MVKNRKALHHMRKNKYSVTSKLPEDKQTTTTEYAAGKDALSGEATR
jgi:hypothetical protein